MNSRHDPRHCAEVGAGREAAGVGGHRTEAAAVLRSLDQSGLAPKLLDSLPDGARRCRDYHLDNVILAPGRKALCEALIQEVAILADDAVRPTFKLPSPETTKGWPSTDQPQPISTRTLRFAHSRLWWAILGSNQ